MFRLMMTWNHPHKGMPGMIITIMPFFLSFFWILTLFTGRLPMFRLAMTWNCPHQGMPGTIVMIMPFFFIFFFFSSTYCFFTGKLPMFGLTMTWNHPHQGMPGTIVTICALFSFFEFLLFFYRKTTPDRVCDDVELSPPRYAGHDCYDHALFLYFIFFFFLNTDLFPFF